MQLSNPDLNSDFTEYLLAKYGKYFHPYRDPDFGQSSNGAVTRIRILRGSDANEPIYLEATFEDGTRKVKEKSELDRQRISATIQSQPMHKVLTIEHINAKMQLNFELISAIWVDSGNPPTYVYQIQRNCRIVLDPTSDPTSDNGWSMGYLLVRTTYSTLPTCSIRC